MKRGPLGVTLLLTFVLLSPAAAETSQSTATTADRNTDGVHSVENGNPRQILVTFKQGTTRQLRGAGSTPRGYSVRKSYKTSPRSTRLAHKLAKDYQLEHVEGWPIELLDVHCVVYRLSEQQSASEMLERLERDPRVQNAQPMQLFEVLGHKSYNDPHFPLQHGLQQMQIPEAHQWSSGRGVRVAVIDTGVDVDHPELSGRVAEARNFVDEDPLTFTRDAHGTAIAGVIASRADNGIGIVGVAPAVKILALKACWEKPDPASGTGATSGAVCSSFTLAKAISFAASNEADILNLSLAGPPDPLLGALLTRVLDAGILVVSALAESNDSSLAFPASLDRVIAVGADQLEAASPSDRLRLGNSLTAPGEDVLTIQPQGAYDFMSGSSLAAAHVSGATALLLQHRPRLTDTAVRSLLSGSDAAPGAGGINACTAISKLLDRPGCLAGQAADTLGPTEPYQPSL